MTLTAPQCRPDSAAGVDDDHKNGRPQGKPKLTSTSQNSTERTIKHHTSSIPPTRPKADSAQAATGGR